MLVVLFRSRTSLITIGRPPMPPQERLRLAMPSYYVAPAQNHPAVVAYSMSHNACGYGEDMNPDMIDGLHDPRISPATNCANANRVLAAEAIVKRFDPARIVYHHASAAISARCTP